jgi:phosphinothricin acetyltransferase
MTARPATPADASDIRRIRNRVILETPFTFTTDIIETDAGILGEISDRGAAFQVFEISGKVQGFATYSSFRAGPGYARTKEHSVMLDPTAHRQGAGTALMTALQAQARSSGVHALVAGISSENPAALRFHTALGFAQVGRLPEVGFKFGRWMDLVLMQKIL